jgi:hypothetical protein
MNKYPPTIHLNQIQFETSEQTHYTEGCKNLEEHYFRNIRRENQTISNINRDGCSWWKRNNILDRTLVNRP